MEFTNEDVQKLRSFKSIVDNDNVRIKEVIKKELLKNKYLIHVLNNKELEEVDANPEDYFGVNIHPFFMLPDIQHSVQNFVCYEVSYRELNRYNSAVKELTVMFYVICEQRNIIDEDTGISRHDLIDALIQDQFNYTNLFGQKLYLTSDVVGVLNDHYAMRTMTFTQQTDNNLVKTRDGIPRLVNNIGVDFP